MTSFTDLGVGWPELERFAKPRDFVQSDSSPGYPADQQANRTTGKRLLNVTATSRMTIEAGERLKR